MLLIEGLKSRSYKLKTIEVFSKKLDSSITSELVRDSYSAELSRKYFGVQKAVSLQLPLPPQKAEKMSSFCSTQCYGIVHPPLLSQGRRHNDSAVASHFLNSQASCFHMLSFICVLMSLHTCLMSLCTIMYRYFFMMVR